MMSTREFLAGMGAAVLGLSGGGRDVRVQASTRPLIRWADLDIDPLKLDSFKAAAHTHAEAVLRTEPGVIAFHAAAEAADPTRIRVLEIYADEAAYRGHLDSPHVKKYVETTGPMIRSRKLFETRPVFLGLRAPPGGVAAAPRGG